MSKWAGSPGPGTLTSCLVYLFLANGSPVEDEPDSSCDDDISVEVISPPRRPVTRSVSAKRAADDMLTEDDDALLVSSSPRARKVRKVTGVPSALADCRQPPVTADPLTGFTGKTPLFAHSQTPESIKVDGVSDSMEADAPFHLEKDYFESENPWEESIAYF